MYKVTLSIPLDGPRYGINFMRGVGMCPNEHIALRMEAKGFKVEKVAPLPGERVPVPVTPPEDGGKLLGLDGDAEEAAGGQEATEQPADGEDSQELDAAGQGDGEPVEDPPEDALPPPSEEVTEGGEVHAEQPEGDTPGEVPGEDPAEQPAGGDDAAGVEAPGTEDAPEDEGAAPGEIEGPPAATGAGIPAEPPAAGGTEPEAGEGESLAAEEQQATPPKQQRGKKKADGAAK